MIYLYGLFEGDGASLRAALEGTDGLQNPLELSGIGPWFLVHSAHDSEEVLPKRRLMLAHTRVLERMMTLGTVLPARFGLVADDLSSACDLIRSQARPVGEAFDRVRGHVELGVRVTFSRPPALEATLAEDATLARQRAALAARGPEAHFAIAEFGGKLAEQLDRRRGAAQRVLLQTLAPLTATHVLRKPEEDTEVLRAEFLVRQDRQETFVAALEQAASELGFAPGAPPQIQIIGPAPMYNFVRLSLTPDARDAAA